MSGARTGRWSVWAYAACLRLNSESARPRDQEREDAHYRPPATGRTGSRSRHCSCTSGAARCCPGHKRWPRAGLRSRQKCPIACRSDKRRSGPTAAINATISQASARACLRRNGTARSPMMAAAICGQRCQWHISHGARCREILKAQRAQNQRQRARAHQSLQSVHHES